MPNYGALDQAIANFEGFNVPGSIAQRQNNPGNLVYGQYAIDHGAIQSGTNGIAVFPDVQTGLQAEDANVGNLVNQGLSLSDLLAKWSPPSADGNSQAILDHYISSVSKSTGYDPNTPLKDQIGKNLAAQSNPAANSSSGSPFGVFGDALNAIGNVGGKIDNLLGTNITASPLTGLFAGFSWGRIGVFLTGVILVCGGLFLFKPVQSIVVTSTKAAIA